MQLDLAPYTTHFHFPVIGRPDHSRGHEVILVDRLCVSELDFVSAGAVPPVLSQHPGVERADDLNAEGGQYGEFRSPEVRGVAGGLRGR